jgi:DNA uptake protein ComE-like DNA-binding protein
VREREARRLKSVDDLKQCGIGEGRFADIRDLVTL